MNAAGSFVANLVDFEYRPLRQDYIRLVRSHPTLNSTDPICCSLDEIDIADVADREDAASPEFVVPAQAPKCYYALSYVWGPKLPSDTIVLKDSRGDRKLAVRRNLQDALRRLRDLHWSRSLWVDRISINQDDLAEREHQVSLMGLIFSKAFRVIVWLGDSDSEENPFADLIGMGEQVSTWVKTTVEAGTIRASQYLDEIIDIPTEGSAGSGRIKSIFANTWFQRIWIVQEIALAYRAIAMQGPHVVSYAVFDQLGGILEKHSRTMDASRIWIVSSMNMLHRLYVLRSWFHGVSVREKQTRDNVSMLQLVLDFRELNATDGRDKIWALLNIADDAAGLNSEISYVKPWQTCYTRFAHWMCSKYGNSSLLRLVRIQQRGSLDPDGDLASWVPDFRAAIPLMDWSYTTVLNPGRLKASSLIGPNRVYSASGHNFFTHVDELHSPDLTVEGVLVGTIASLSVESGNLSDGRAIGPAVEDDGPWNIMARAHASINGLYPSTDEAIDTAFSRLRIGDRVLDGEHWRPSRHLYAEGIPRVNALLVDVSQGGTTRWTIECDTLLASYIIHATHSRKFFVTDTGYMGLTHQTNLIGDLVWILKGADMPVVLRRMSKSSGSVSRPLDHFAFRGDSYVHGIMDGEFLVVNGAESRGRESVEGSNRYEDQNLEAKAWKTLALS